MLMFCVLNMSVLNMSVLNVRVLNMRGPDVSGWGASACRPGNAPIEPPDTIDSNRKKLQHPTRKLQCR